MRDDVVSRLDFYPPIPRPLLPFKRWAIRRQMRRGWKPGTIGYSPSLAMIYPNGWIKGTRTPDTTWATEFRRSLNGPRP